MFSVHLWETFLFWLRGIGLSALSYFKGLNLEPELSRPVSFAWKVDYNDFPWRLKMMPVALNVKL